MLFAGIDVGSQSTACVLWDGRNILGFSILPSGVNPKKRAQEALEKALEIAGKKDAQCFIAATGYGRYQVEGAQLVVSEITCQAKGVAYFFPKAKTVIDIGGQDSKIIRLGEGGKVLDFVMNDKCAAGTGRFLELMARVLEIRLEDYGELFTQAKERLSLSHTCAVFAESELIGYIAQGKQKEDLVRAVADAVAERVAALGERLGIVSPLVLTGGVAKNKAVLTLLGERLKCPILVPEEPLMTAALGACLLAEKRT